MKVGLWIWQVSNYTENLSSFQLLRKFRVEKSVFLRLITFFEKVIREEIKLNNG
jgi:hypothetical protein